MTRRYDITNDDRLRNVVNVERISPDSLYLDRRLGVRGPARQEDKQKADPDCPPGDRRALPHGRHRRRHGSSSRRTASRSCGSKARTRSAPLPAREWDLRRLTPWGQEFTLTAYGRGDIYHTDDAESTVVPIYRGARWLARPRDRRAWPRTSNGRSSVRCSAACSGWSPACSSCSPRRRRTSTSRTRMRARSTSRTATCSRSTASPATTGGRTARASPTASTGRSIARTCRSTATSDKAIRFTAEPGYFP